jgi:hypothetical protein
MTGGFGRTVQSRARLHCVPRGAGIMSRQPQLPKGHSSILSPTFRYVPAASTGLAQTLARIRCQRLAQLAPLGTGASVPVWKPKAAG